MTRAQSEPSSSLRGIHVLLVDEDVESLDLLASVLRYAGALVTACDAPGTALRAMQRVRPTVLVIDLESSAENGSSLIREVRALPVDQGAPVPAVALTPVGRPVDRERLLAAGFQVHLVKPVHVSELCHAIATLGRWGSFQTGAAR